MNAVEAVLNNEQDVLNYLKDRFPVFHLSNIFFRDIHFGIQSYLKGQHHKVGYTAAEGIARQFIAQLEQKRTLRPVDRQTWVVDHVAFKKPMDKPAVAAKNPSATAVV
jgi:hypothetical protein